MTSLLDKLSRITSDNRYIKEIDGLRFLAIVTVVMLHTSTHLTRTFSNTFSQVPGTTLLGWISARGGLGVDVFFAISGFILSLPFINYYRNEGKEVSVKKYYIRRLTRLEPPYIISLSLLFIIQLLIGRLIFDDSWRNFVASLFYVHNIVYDKWSIINPVAWSLEVEVQFYLLAPLLFFLIFRIRSAIARRLLMFIVIILMIALNFYFTGAINDLLLRKSLVAELHLFLIGVLFADYFLIDGLPRDKNFLYDLAGVIAISNLFISKDRDVFVVECLYAFSILLIFLAAFNGKVMNYFFTRKIVTVIGGMCYSIYLWHYALLAILITITGVFFVGDSYLINMIIQSALLWPCVLVVSSLFFYFIEKPCMNPNWINQLKARLKSQP